MFYFVDITCWKDIFVENNVKSKIISFFTFKNIFHKNIFDFYVKIYNKKPHTHTFFQVWVV